MADSAPGEEELSARLRTPPEALGWSKPMPDLVIHNPTGEPRPVELINGKPTDAELGVYEFGSLPEDLRRGTLADERKATSEGGPDEAEPGVVR